MKKIITLTIPFTIALILLYCFIFKSNIQKEKEYYKINTDDKNKYYYYIYDKNHKIAKESKTEANTLSINQIYDNILEIREDYGTGIIYQTFYNIENNKFSQQFIFAIAYNDSLIAYFEENNILIIQNIFNKNIYYKEFKNNNITGKDIIEGNIIDAYFTKDNKELIIKYYKNNVEQIEKIAL